MSTPWSHDLRVRYSEVDNQGVVYNSRYLEYVDHAVTMWLRSRGLVYEDLRHGQWDFALRHAECDWIAPARADEVLSVDVALVRAGTTSFEVSFAVRRADEVVFRAQVVYVGLDPSSGGGKAPLPPFVRDALGA